MKSEERASLLERRSYEFDLRYWNQVIHWEKAEVTFQLSDPYSSDMFDPAQSQEERWREAEKAIQALEQG